jgi:8-oxo-dGTP pyrophosphatase MutT (NUDIX family)
MASLWTSGLNRVLEGVTTIDELLRVAEPPAPGRPAMAPGDRMQPRRRAARALHSPAGGAPDPDQAVRAAHPSADDSEAGVTEIKVGTIDVYVIRELPDGWRVLVLQRSLDTRCPTAWESVHGRLEAGEEPDAGALRELREETGLEAERFYVIAAQPYYLKAMRTVQMSIAFAAFVAEPAEVVLGPEHQSHEWVTVEEALSRFAWPRERQALAEIRSLLGNGHAGPLEDVLRVEW